jgi:hypothetical protein
VPPRPSLAAPAPLGPAGHRRPSARPTVIAATGRLGAFLEISGAFFHIWGRVGLMSALSVIFMSVLTTPAPPSREIPALVGTPRTVSTTLGEVEVAPVKVFSTGAIVEVHAELAATPTDLLARPDEVLKPSPEHDAYALTLRTRASGPAAGTPRQIDATGEHHPHQWDLAFWIPRAAWAGSAPRLVWPVAHLDTPLELDRLELEKATLVVRPRDQ